MKPKKLIIIMEDDTEREIDLKEAKSFIMKNKFFPETKSRTVYIVVEIEDDQSREFALSLKSSRL